MEVFVDFLAVEEEREYFILYDDGPKFKKTGMAQNYFWAKKFSFIYIYIYL